MCARQEEDEASKHVPRLFEALSPMRCSHPDLVPAFYGMGAQPPCFAGGKMTVEGGASDDIDLAKQYSQHPEDSQESKDQLRQARQQIQFWSTRPVKRLISHAFFPQLFDLFFAS
jgi:hypothetical protein